MKRLPNLARALLASVLGTTASSLHADPGLDATAGAGSSLVRIDVGTQKMTKLGDFGVPGADAIAMDTTPRPSIRPSAGFRHTAVFRDRRVTLVPNATGVGPLTYRWRRDGLELVGKTNKSLTLLNVQPTDEGDYTVEVSNPGGTLITPPVRLWVVPPATEFTKHSFTNVAGKRLPYLAHRPAEFDAARRYPLVLIVHGGGDWHEDRLPAGFWDWPEVSVFASYRQQTRDPVILVYPTHRAEVGGGGWSTQETELIAELMDRLVADLPVDPDRVYVCGGSASFEAAARVAGLRRERLAAALLHSGYLRADPALKGLPIWTFQTALEGRGADAFSGELRGWGGHPLHTQFKTASHEEVYEAKSTSPAVVQWLLAQRRGRPEAGSPVLIVDQPVAASLPHTGASALDLAGRADGLGKPVLSVAWENVTLKRKGAAFGREDWVASGVPLVPHTTNVIVVTASVTNAWAPALGGTTAFSDTLFVFSTPVRLSLRMQNHDATLDWTGGVPPFAVQLAPTVDAAAWDELFPNATPPVTVPAPGPTQFYRVMGR